LQLVTTLRRQSVLVLYCDTQLQFLNQLTSARALTHSLMSCGLLTFNMCS